LKSFNQGKVSFHEINTGGDSCTLQLVNQALIVPFILQADQYAIKMSQTKAMVPWTLTHYKMLHYLFIYLFYAEIKCFKIKTS
jgi:hypothetical protein